MADLPERPALDQLRRQAKELLRAVNAGSAAAVRRMRAHSGHPTLAAAQLAVARSYGFKSWPKLKREVERRTILNGRDLGRIRRLIDADPSWATDRMEHWRDHRLGVAPLSYVAMLRFDADRLGLSSDLPGTGAVARSLLAAGAPVDGGPRESETPLITAASYGDAEVARELIAAGADIDALSTEDSGGVPGGSALLHAAVFGMTEVVDVLIAAGARVRGVEEAAAAGTIDDWLTPETDVQARIRSLIMAAHHERLDTIDQLIAAGTPIDAIDKVFGRQALRTAAEDARPASVRYLLALGANPHLRDEEGRTALDLCRDPHSSRDRARSREVEAILVAAMTG